MLRKLHKYANPNKFSLIIMPIKNVCLYTALPLIAIGLIIGLFFLHLTISKEKQLE